MSQLQGSKLRLYPGSPIASSKAIYVEMLCIKTSTSLGSLQKFEEATGEFKGALGSRHPLISSPATMNMRNFASAFWR